MNKSLFFFFLALVVLVGVGCGTQKNTAKSAPAAPVRVEKAIIQALNSDGLTNIRFRFEQEFQLVLIDEPGNGVYEVNDKGNLVLLNEKTIRFPSNKLGKFLNPARVRDASSFEMTWEEDSPLLSGTGSEALGAPILRGTYNDSLQVIVSPDGLYKGKPFVVYQKAKYFLPDNYQQYLLVVGKEGKGQPKTVTGVRTPGGQMTN